MMINNAICCEKCGSELELVDRYVSMETYRCKSCGHLQYFHVSDSISDIEEFAKTLKRVIIVWDKKPDARQLMQLKKMLPEFKSETLLTLKSKLENSDRWDLGNYSESDALELSRKINGLGISRVLVE